jgi:CBS domain-containing protein
MKVETVYRAEVIGIRADESLADAAGLMQFNEVGALPVSRDGVMTGIVTERDLVRAMADGVSPDTTAVEDYMTADPVSIGPDMSLREVADRMLQLGVRHLPVMVGDRTVGMVSVRDLLVEVGA